MQGPVATDQPRVDHLPFGRQPNAVLDPPTSPGSPRPVPYRLYLSEDRGVRLENDDRQPQTKEEVRKTHDGAIDKGRPLALPLHGLETSATLSKENPGHRTVSEEGSSGNVHKNTKSPSNSEAKSGFDLNGIRDSLVSDMVSVTDSKHDRSLKLTQEQLQQLASTPESLPLRPIPRRPSQTGTPFDNGRPSREPTSENAVRSSGGDDIFSPLSEIESISLETSKQPTIKNHHQLTIETNGRPIQLNPSPGLRPIPPQRSSSTPGLIKSPKSPPRHERPRPSLKPPISGTQPDVKDARRYSSSGRPLPSPMPSSFPLPPLSIPTYLQLELSSQRPSQLYIHRPAGIDFPYESSSVKIERLLNFLLLPPHLESVLWFGTLACLDAWLYTFTILPLRLLKSFYILGQSWASNLMQEVSFVFNFVYNGTGRMWGRRRSSIVPRPNKKTASETDERNSSQPAIPPNRRQIRHHHRTKSVPSTLLPDDKADMLKGLLIICTCLILLRFDASRMYHWIRGQAAIKLYVIYNLLEVCDRLFSAIGQDVLECLFSRETLERKPDGHSKILRPLWLFCLALVYTVIHSTALFYQVITLNVAVNSYSNALITLLMSNQFVEIKSTVFKKFEKENLFQLTCADVVERFQLWHMLVIIAARNIVETGGLLSWFDAFTFASSNTSSAVLPTNSSFPFSGAVPPKSASSIIPRSFTLVPAMVESITSYAPAINQVIGPFLIVLGSEMLVDWIKHAYINKFNNTRPAIYDRFLDVLAKDYYTNAFGDQNLTKRLGLPVIPLSCLLIRASVQTYQMFVASWVPSTPPTSSTSLESIHEQFSTSRSTMPMTTGAAISRTVDEIIKAIPAVITKSRLVTHLPTVLTFLLIFLLLLACKLVLGMVLLAFSRSRYRSMKQREKESVHQVEGGRRVGGWGVVEVDDDKRRWIYEDDPAGLRALREKEERDKQKQQKEKEKGFGLESFDKVKRYEMAAKRIW